MRRRQLSLEEYRRGVEAGDRAVLARAITLVESHNPEHAELARQLLVALLPRAGGAVRVGITGPPGVGKSTFIDTLGMALVERGHRVAVLAIDPSSALSGGSILGDKTRMARLAVEPGAYVRPSPSGASLGGVARRTREALLLCEAAGFDVVLVETVGVGQSETMVAEMVDTFLVLLLPGAGDELQGIKKGLMELADVLAINKADGDNLGRANHARQQVAAALRYLRPRSAAWRPEVLAVSGLTGAGLDALWQAVLDHRAALEAAGELEERRRAQEKRWMWRLVEEGLLEAFRADPAVRAALPAEERAVEEGRTTAAGAAGDLLARFLRAPRG